MTFKKVAAVYSAPGQHWVGDGFPVRSMLTYDRHAELISPFLLLDYAGPMRFEPTEQPRGVGPHPHRGFETVTIVYDGEVAHRDSTGAGGTIGPGDVQWMTAASGILHDEFHSPAFTRQGGQLEMVQLWVNLPAKDKMSAPGYQELRNKDIPEVALPGGAGAVRIIAGTYRGHVGAARTFTPLDVWDVRLNAAQGAELEFAADRTLVIVVLRGSAVLNGDVVNASELALFDRNKGRVTIDAKSEARLLVLSGEPIDEPVVGYGPFVMNSDDEIRQAVADFRHGDFGQL